MDVLKHAAAGKGEQDMRWENDGSTLEKGHKNGGWEMYRAGA